MTNGENDTRQEPDSDVLLDELQTLRYRFIEGARTPREANINAKRMMTHTATWYTRLQCPNP